MNIGYFKLLSKMLVIGGILTSLPALAKKPELTFCVDNWEGLTNKDGTGTYSELVKKVYESEYKVTIKLFPWARAQQEFQNGKCTGLIAESKSDEATTVKPKIVLDALELQAYFLKGRVKYQGEKTLRTKALGWLRGYNYHKLVDYKMNYIEFNNVHAGFKMLEAQRFDIMLDYIYTFKDECKSSGADCTKIDSTPSGIIERAYVVFANNKQGVRLSKLWDEKMTELIKLGFPQGLYEKYGQKYPMTEVPPLKP